MAKCGIFNHPDHGFAVVSPASTQLSLVDICRAVVPVGVQFLVIDSEEIPDIRFREAFELDLSNPDGVGVGFDVVMAEQAAQEQQA